MNRLASNKTTRPLLYGAMGSGILLLPLALDDTIRKAA